MTTQEIHDALFEKVEKEWNAYVDTLHQLSPGVLVGMAKEISATSFCYNELIGANAYNYPDKHLAFLLRLENPLEVMRDKWLEEESVVRTEEFDHALWSVVQDSGTAQDYSFDPKYINAGSDELPEASHHAELDQTMPGGGMAIC